MFLLDEIKNVVHSIDSKTDVILFGSRARKDARNDSDWDILILVDYSVTLKIESKFINVMFLLMLEHDVVISTFVYNRKEWKTKYSITNFLHIKTFQVLF